jgi:hypothetical protein
MPTMASILADVFGQVGLTSSQYDVSQATDVVDGFVITDRQDARSAIENLLRAYQTFLTEVDGKIVAVKRGAAPAQTIPAGDLGAQLTEGTVEAVPPVEVRRLQDLELPFRLDVTFFSRTRHYQQTQQSAIRYSKINLNDAVTIQLPLVLLDNQGRQIAEELLYQQWVEKEQFTFSLPWGYLALTPGDVLNLPCLGQTLRIRIIQVDVGLFGPLAYTAVQDDPTILTQTVPGAATLVSGELTADLLATTMIAWTGPALQDADASSVGLYVVAGPTADGYWPGCTVYWSRDGGTTYQELVTLDDPATIGTAAGALAGNPATGTGAFDNTNTVTVNFPIGTAPTTTTDGDLFGGANPFLLGDEVIQAGTVTPIGGTSYTLSHLLRARRGTDAHWNEHLTGERVVVLDTGPTTRVPLTEDLKGKQLFLKAVTAGTTLAATTAVSLYVTGDEYRPYAPVQLTKSRDGSNNLTVNWLRRARTNAEMRDGSDIPLGETTEAYDVAVLDKNALPVSGVQLGATTVITVGSHGYSIGDLIFLQGITNGPVYLNGRIVTITATTTNTFTVNDGSLGMTAWTAGGTTERVKRVISVVTPTASYTAAQQTTDGFIPGFDLYELVIFQIGKFGRGFPYYVSGV